MSMNAIWLLLPVTAIGIWLFTSIYERQDTRIDTERAKVELRQAEHDERFANAWNGQQLSGVTELEAKREKVKQAEEREEAARQANANALKDIQTRLKQQEQ